MKRLALGCRAVVQRRLLRVSSMSGTKTKRVLVVGAGITGAYTAHAIAVGANAAKEEVEIEIWDKARGVGGRMSTKRATVEACMGGRCDTGAQYISRHPSTHGVVSIDRAYEHLLQSGTLRSWDEADHRIRGVDERRKGLQNYVVPAGMSSLVKAFLPATSTTHFGRHVQNVCVSAESSGKLSVTALGKDGEETVFDAVVVTAPVPQVIGMLGGERGAEEVLPVSVHSALSEVSYSSRYALSCFFSGKDGTADAAAAALAKRGLGGGKGGGGDGSTDGVALYFGAGEGLTAEGEPCLRFICNDTAKKNEGTAPAAPAAGVTAAAAEATGEGDLSAPKSKCLSVLLHTGVPYGRSRLGLDGGAAASDAEVRDEILGALRKAVPGIPRPSEAILNRWKYSQVHKGVDVREVLEREEAEKGRGASASGLSLRTDVGLGGSKQQAMECLVLSPDEAKGGVGAGAQARSEGPALVFAGDAFASLGSRFDGCISSGADAAEAVLAALFGISPGGGGGGGGGQGGGKGKL